jgi:hypothetical protein
MADLPKSRSGRALAAAIEAVHEEHGPGGEYGEFVAQLGKMRDMMSGVGRNAETTPGRQAARDAGDNARSNPPAKVASAGDNTRSTVPDNIVTSKAGNTNSNAPSSTPKVEGNTTSNKKSSVVSIGNNTRSNEPGSAPKSVGPTDPGKVPTKASGSQTETTTAAKNAEKPYEPRGSYNGESLWSQAAGQAVERLKQS